MKVSIPTVFAVIKKKWFNLVYVPPHVTHV